MLKDLKLLRISECVKEYDIENLKHPRIITWIKEYDVERPDETPKELSLAERV